LPEGSPELAVVIFPVPPPPAAEPIFRCGVTAGWMERVPAFAILADSASTASTLLRTHSVEIRVMISLSMMAETLLGPL
jgi:hypothetical protein